MVNLIMTGIHGAVVMAGGMLSSWMGRHLYDGVRLYLDLQEIRKVPVNVESENNEK